MRVESGDVAWMLVATALVWLMLLPGLALFYGGLVRAKNLLSILAQVLGVGALAVLIWVGWGYSLAFGGGGAVIGDLSKAGLIGMGPDSLWALGGSGKALPELLFAAFQMSFAAITVALVTGAVAERMRFAAMMLFGALFLTFVYAPLAHMVWSPGGLLFTLGAIDFAGGTVVHVNAGVAGLVAAAMIGPRIGWPREPMPPHNLALVLVGTGLLWTGWVGFNAGSALEAGGLASLALMNTMVAPAAGAIAWMGMEAWRSGKPSLLGGASGAVPGLVAVTPAAGVAGPLGSMMLGAVTASLCYLFIARVKQRWGLDDSLDVFGIHGLGGIIGSLGTAIVAAPALGGFGAEGYAMLPQLWKQAAAVVIAMLWSAGGSAIAFLAVGRLVRVRHEEDSEREGLDIVDHGERAYN
jgi:Amt family ammonium transporter